MAFYIIRKLKELKENQILLSICPLLSSEQLHLLILLLDCHLKNKSVDKATQICPKMKTCLQNEISKKQHYVGT